MRTTAWWSRNVIGSALLVVTCAAFAREPAWVGSWGASPLPPGPAAGPFPPTPSYANRTIRQVVRLSVGGEALRLRLTNEYGTGPLTIGAARVAVVGSDTQRVVTFGGAPAAVISAGSPLLSDPVDIEVADLATVAISLYFPDDTGPCTCHQVSMQAMLVSGPGDHTAGDFAPAETTQGRAFLSGVDVLTRAAGVVVTLGDSITDGVGSTADANHRWPDLLAERLASRRGRARFGIVNEGISGNRVLADGAGVSALARFDRDVLSVPGATHVIVFEGVNDLGFAYGDFSGSPLANARSLFPAGPEVTAAALIAGYRQVIARAHAKGLKVYGATIAPYEGASYYSAQGETVRQAVNTWIRTGGEFDAVLDFDAVLRDPAAPSRMREGFHAGDYLHGSDAGYRALADSIDLALF